MPIEYTDAPALRAAVTASSRDALLDTSRPSVSRTMTRPERLLVRSAFADSMIPSYRAVPERASIVSPLSTDSMSAVEVEKSESLSALRPNATTATRSSGRLCRTNVRAAEPALARPTEPIDRDVSISISKLFAAPRYTASHTVHASHLLVQ